MAAASACFCSKPLACKIKPADQAGLAKTDVPWLLGAICAGGIAAPIVLMFGLRSTPAATASLLLNFEGAATSVIAAIMFREALGRRIWLAVALITAASVILSWDTTGSLRFSIGAIGIVGACVLWGLDNNVTRHISAKDPLAITIAKGISAGIVSLGIAFALGNRLPSFGLYRFGSRARLLCLWPEYRVLHLGDARSGRGTHERIFRNCAVYRGIIVSLSYSRQLAGYSVFVCRADNAGRSYLPVKRKARTRTYP